MKKYNLNTYKYFSNSFTSLNIIKAFTYFQRQYRLQCRKDSASIFYKQKKSTISIAKTIHKRKFHFFYTHCNGSQHTVQKCNIFKNIRGSN